jgi:hypothetical protein
MALSRSGPDPLEEQVIAADPIASTISIEAQPISCCASNAVMMRSRVYARDYSRFQST